MPTRFIGWVAMSTVGFLASANLLTAQTPQPAAFEDAVLTAEGLVDALYASVSFDPGEDPDWDLVRSFFLDEAVMVFATEPARPAQIMDLDAFIEDFETFYREANVRELGFHENLQTKHVVTFGNAAHVWTTFAPRVGSDSGEPARRGVDSINLVRHGGRWWVASINTDFEGPDKQIPEGFPGH